MTRLSYKGKEALIQSFSFGTSGPRDFYYFVCNGNLRRSVLDLIKDYLNSDYYSFIVSNMVFASNKLSDFYISGNPNDGFIKFKLTKFIVKDNDNSVEHITFGEKLDHVSVDKPQLEDPVPCYSVTMLDQNGDLLKCRTFGISDTLFNYTVPSSIDFRDDLTKIEIIFHTSDGSGVVSKIIADLEHKIDTVFKVTSITIV